MSTDLEPNGPDGQREVRVPFPEDPTRKDGYHPVKLADVVKGWQQTALMRRTLTHFPFANVVLSAGHTIDEPAEMLDALATVVSSYIRECEAAKKAGEQRERDIAGMRRVLGFGNGRSTA